MNKDVFKMTFKITFILFYFIAFLIYLLYCYAYYDKNLKDLYYEKAVSLDYEFIYKNMVDKDGLEEKDFYDTINLMTDHKELKSIYYLYYRDCDIFSLDEFMKNYYYDNIVIDSDAIFYTSNGKTSLFSRMAIFYDYIKIVNSSDSSVLGVVRDITFEVEEDSILKIDNKEVKCSGTTCKLSKIFGGLHQISYVSNGFQYYGLINISKDSQVVSVTNLDSLVRVDIVSDNDIEVDSTDQVVLYDLKVGEYSLNKCYLDSGCPTAKKSYLRLGADGSCEFYTYISLDKAGDLYSGTYTIEDNFLVMKFNGHTYQVFDYDTKESTDINADVDIVIKFKIEANDVLVNDSYRFKLKS